MDQETTRIVLKELNSILHKFNEIGLLLQSRVDEAEFKDFWSSVGKVFGEIDDSILEPIFRQHPELAPADSPRLDPAEIDASRDRMFNEFIRNSPAWIPLITEIGELEVKRRYLGYSK